MSKIITKRQLNTLIESTLKEYNPYNDTFGMEHLHGNNDSYMSVCQDPKNKEYDSAHCVQWRDKNSTKNEDYMKNTCNECGGMMYEGTCNECGMSYMGEGKKPETEKEKEFAALAEPKDEITYADKIAGAKKNEGEKMEEDTVEESAKDLAESVTKTFNPTFLTEDMDNFKKLINYRNK